MTTKILPSVLPLAQAAIATPASATQGSLSYTLRLRDHNLNPVGELTDFLDCDLVLRMNDVSKFVLTVRADNALASSFAAGNGIIVSRDLGDGSGAQTLFSGPIWHLERRGRDNTFILAGPDDLWWMKARRANPAAGLAYDTRTGTASTVIQAYVNANAGPGAAASRRVAGLAIAADPLIGSSVTGNARYDELLALLQQLAVSGGDIGFKLLQTANGVLTFSSYQPQTRSNAIFSTDLGNLFDYSYSLDGPNANYDTAGGGGQGVSRVFQTGQDTASINTWGLVEGFIDARDTSDSATLTQRINADLAQNKQQTNLSITPSDTAALAYGRDYNLGDVVTVIIDGSTITDKVRSVHIQLTSADGEIITPGIGNPSAGQVAALFDHKAAALASINQQVKRLQTAQ